MINLYESSNYSLQELNKEIELLNGAIQKKIEELQKDASDLVTKKDLK